MQGDTQKRILRSIERQTVEYLIDEADTTLDHPEQGSIVDTVRVAVNALRNAGHGGASDAPSSTTIAIHDALEMPGGVEVYSEALWLLHPDVFDALLEAYESAFNVFHDTDDGFDGGPTSFEGYTALRSKHAPDDAIVLFDPRALSENPARHGMPPSLARYAATDTFRLHVARPFLVTDPTGVVVIRI